MKANMKVSGFPKVKAVLRNIADRVPKNAARTMRRSAEIILEEAKLNTPRDWGSLEEAIKMREGRGPRGRLEIDIYVDGAQPVLGRYSLVTVDQYAWIIHENYDHLVESKTWKPGKETVKKMLQNPGRHIGSFFLTRAVDEERPRLMKKMIQAVAGVIQEEGMA